MLLDEMYSLTVIFPSLSLLSVPMLQVMLPGDDQTALTVEEGERHTIIVSVPQPNLIEVLITVSVSSDTAEKGTAIEGQ